MKDGLYVLGDFEGSYQLVVTDLAADGRAEFIEMSRIREDAAFSLCIQQRQSEIGGYVAGLFVFFDCPFP